LGTSDAPDPAADLTALAKTFDIARFGRSSPRFDPTDLAAFSAKVLHAMPFAEAKARLDAMGLAGADAAFWNAVGGNLEKFDDVRVWHAVCYGDVAPAMEDADFCRTAAGLLPPEPWDEAT